MRCRHTARQGPRRSHIQPQRRPECFSHTDMYRQVYRLGNMTSLSVVPMRHRQISVRT